MAPSDADRAFGALLRRARDDAGRTSQQIADEIFFERRSVDRWLSGERRPDKKTVAAFEAICGVSSGELQEAWQALPPRVPADDGRGDSEAETTTESPSLTDEPPVEVTLEGETETDARSSRWSAVVTVLAIRGAAALAFAGVCLVAYALGHGDDRPAAHSATSYAEAMNEITARLDGLRVPTRTKLRATQSAAGREAASETLSLAFAQALDAQARLAAPRGVELAHRRIRDAMRRARDGYRSMALAARSPRDFRAAARRVGRAEAALEAGLRILRASAATRRRS